MGDSTTKLYRRWRSMNDRCKNSNVPSYKNYGERGVTVCPEWDSENKDGFSNFKKWFISQGYDENQPKGAQTIDRIDNTKGYSPDNCRIISNFEQQGNTRKNIFVTFKGETHHVSEWARKLGISKTCLLKRLKKMSVDEAFSKPLKPTNIRYSFEYNGKTYHSLTEAVNELGINLKRTSYLIHKGFSITEAIDSQIKKGIL